MPIRTFYIYVHWSHFDISNGVFTNWENIAKNGISSEWSRRRRFIWNQGTTKLDTQNRWRASIRAKQYLWWTNNNLQCISDAAIFRSHSCYIYFHQFEYTTNCYPFWSVSLCVIRQCRLLSKLFNGDDKSRHETWFIVGSTALFVLQSVLCSVDFFLLVLSSNTIQMVCDVAADDQGRVCQTQSCNIWLEGLSKVSPCDGSAPVKLTWPAVLRMEM